MPEINHCVENIAMMYKKALSLNGEGAFAILTAILCYKSRRPASVRVHKLLPKRRLI
ncbi:hypothetical protein XNC3_120016 [Xenorhabdus nematophila F1]|nr:hypothetical protein XNC3_120016 [Xenorhabdus nematophila F1]CEE94797.1 hypothetical protein XNA1_4810017 [Xenorhabdus nematophila str. Anatoliense]CEF31521.1 hypothetical protein XNW1_3850017 [Xenorhabdus nematophila str. Websteri]CEK21498.1 protein of unknown function [Xenorhabdus nematophila AN6/1]